LILLTGCAAQDAATPVPPATRTPATPEPVCTDGEVREATCPDGVTTYPHENCVHGQWVVIKYFRDPCEPLPKAISSFEECVEAGYPVMESYPRQCRTPDGRTFVEEIGSGEEERPRQRTRTD